MTTLAPNDFTHLHVHSEFSLLDGLGRITDLVDAAAAAGLRQRSRSPTTAPSTAPSPSTRRRQTKGIKPIIGVETYVARRSMTDKEGKADAQPFHLILLAKDLVGYRNLCRLVTDAHIDGYYYKPRIDREHLAQHSEGLIGLSACLSGEIPRGARGRGLGARPGTSPASTATSSARTASSSSSRTTACPSSGGSTSSSSGSRPEAGLPLVVTNDLHYVRRGPVRGARRPALRRHRQQPRHAEPDEVRDRTTSTLKSAAQMAALFPDQPEAIRNTRRIAEMTDLDAAARPAPDPALPGARRRHRRDAGSARSASAASRAATGR